jgi:hypothetical protein
MDFYRHWSLTFVSSYLRRQLYCTEVDEHTRLCLYMNATCQQMWQHLAVGGLFLSHGCQNLCRQLMLMLGWYSRQLAMQTLSPIWIPFPVGIRQRFLFQKDFSSAVHSANCLKHILKCLDPIFFRLVFFLGMSDLLHHNSPIVHKMGHRDYGNTPNSNGSGIVSTWVDIVGYANK